MRIIEEFLPYADLVVLGNTVADYAAAAAVFVVVWLALWVFRVGLLSWLRRVSEKTAMDADDMLVELFGSLNLPFYLLVSLGAAAQLIVWPSFVSTLGLWLAGIVLFYAATRASTRLVDYLFSRLVKKRLQEDGRFDDSAVRLLSRAVRGLVWVVALLLVVQNLGFDITALVAGLGLGGLAVAFALQSILADAFASFSIYFDRPFRTGDFIIVGDQMGTVKHIGIKSTRIQSLSGEEAVLPNKNLTDAEVHNYGKMDRRRVVFSLGLTYDTKPAKLRRVPGMIQAIIESKENTAFDRAHFKAFGDFSLQVETVYYVTVADYATYMDTHEQVNLEILEAFAKEGIEFAFPTRTVHVTKP